jgi:hypothetical protein
MNGVDADFTVAAALAGPAPSGRRTFRVRR